MNRNYDADWSIGRSRDLCSIIYAGTGPFSEPESRAHRDDMAKLGKVDAVLSYHAKG